MRQPVTAEAADGGDGRGEPLRFCEVGSVIPSYGGDVGRNKILMRFLPTPLKGGDFFIPPFRGGWGV